MISNQQGQKSSSRTPAERRVLMVVAGVMVIIIGLGISWYVQARNRWPEEYRRTLEDLKARGVPTTFAELDRQYRALGNDAAAIQHFQKAFDAMSKEEPPHFDSNSVQSVPLALPGISEMVSPVHRDLVKKYLEKNAEALKLLREGMFYNRCLFPIKITDGRDARIPHLARCKRGADLLNLDCIVKHYDGEPERSAPSLAASLHMAEILRDEPDLVGVAVQSYIVRTCCTALQMCLDLTPFSTHDLALISTRLQGAMEANTKGLKSGLDATRCGFISVFRGSDQEIADFMEEGHGGLYLRLGVENLRAKGMLQRDALYFERTIDQIEASSANPSLEQLAKQIIRITREVEQNHRVDPAVHTERAYIISCAYLPAIIKEVRRYIRVQILGEETQAAIAAELYRQEYGRLPPDLNAQVPKYLPRVYDDPYTGQPIRFRILPRGYAVYAESVSSHDTSSSDLLGKSKSESDEIIFKVER